MRSMTRKIILIIFTFALLCGLASAGCLLLQKSHINANAETTEKSEIKVIHEVESYFYSASYPVDIAGTSSAYQMFRVYYENSGSWKIEEVTEWAVEKIKSPYGIVGESITLNLWRNPTSGRYHIMQSNASSELIDEWYVVLDCDMRITGVDNGAVVSSASIETHSQFVTCKYLIKQFSLTTDGFVTQSNWKPYSFNPNQEISFTVEGAYVIIVTDLDGTTNSLTFCVISSVRSFSPNFLSKSGYPKRGNYTVTIPDLYSVDIPSIQKDGTQAKYTGSFPNTKTYLFSSYDNALAFAESVEMAMRVLKVDGGLRYKQENNENAYSLYVNDPAATMNMSAFYSALEKYSKKYVKKYDISLTEPYFDAYIEVMDDAVYCQRTENGIPFLVGEQEFRSETYSFEGFEYTMLSRLKIVQGGNVLYEGSFVEGRTFREYVTNRLPSGGNGGEYTVTEYDSVGNIYTYKVYYDLTPPHFLAIYEYWENNASGKTLESTLKSRKFEFYANGQINQSFKSLIVTQLLDDADSIITAVVLLPSGERVRTDDTAELTFGAGYNYTSGGEYHILLYDRSGNCFDFAFVIYGGAPRVSSFISGVGNNKTITIEWANANSYSSIVAFEIYRYGERIDGEYAEVIDGKTVNLLYIEQNVWSYRFYLGGRYIIRFLDSFDRVTDSEEIVFSKGLPTYTLSVENGSTTRKEVSLTYETTTGYRALHNGVAVTLSPKTTSDGYKIIFPATQENNGKWEIELYLLSDVPTNIALSFSIDTIAPTAKAVDKEGQEIKWNTTVNTPFKLIYDANDVARVRYELDGVSKAYAAETLLQTDGKYAVTLTDDVGNSITYSLALDMTVELTAELTGKSYIKSGITYLNGSFVLTSPEQLYIELTRDGKTLMDAKFGMEFMTEGHYEIYARDAVGNERREEIYIDLTPPTTELVQGEDKYAPVKLMLDPADVENITVRKDGAKIAVELAAEITFTAYGDYEAILKDALGNSCEIAWRIEKRPPVIRAFTVEGEELEGESVTNCGIYFVWDDEAASARITRSGELSKAYEQNTVYEQEGIYTVVVTDSVKNQVTMTLTVRKTIAYKLLSTSGTYLTPLWSDGAQFITQSFVLEFGDDICVTAWRDGEEFHYESGDSVGTDATYVFLFSDGVGNTEKFTVVRKATAPDIAVHMGAEAWDAVSVEISADAKSVTVKRSITGVSETCQAELCFVLSLWGDYVITATDAFGNTRTAQMSIVKKAPTVTVLTTTGHVIADGETVNSPAYIECSDADAVVRYLVTGSYNRVYAAGTILSEQGNYLVSVVDLAGNKVTREFSLDCSIRLGVWVDGVKVSFDDALIGKNYAELEPQEPLVVTASVNGENRTYTEFPIRIDEESEYIFSVRDAAQNEMLIKITIDRTPPAYECSETELTKNDVIVTIFDLRDIAQYRLKRNEQTVSKFVLAAFNIFQEEGEYTLTLWDALGNSTIAAFSIKRTISYKLSIPSEFLSSDAVTLTAKEYVTLAVTRDGESVSAEAVGSDDYIFKEDGNYIVTLSDVVGNEKTLSFQIDTRYYKKEFSYTIPRDATMWKLTKSGVTIASNTAWEGDVIKVTEDGEYTLMLRKDNKTAIYAFAIDTIMPCIIVNGTSYAIGEKIGHLKKDFTIETNKRTCNVRVFFNGKEVDYSTSGYGANGKYSVRIEDAVGNVAEYEFYKDFTLNSGSVILIFMCGLVVVIVLVFLIRRRIKMRIR